MMIFIIGILMLNVAIEDNARRLARRCGELSQILTNNQKTLNYA